MRPSIVQAADRLLQDEPRARRLRARAAGLELADGVEVALQALAGLIARTPAA